MTVRQRQRLAILLLGLFCLSLAAGLALYALGSNINLFFSPSQIAAGEAPVDRDIRIGGLVEDDSVRRGSEGLEVEFVLTDGAETVRVHYTGILPDLFREGQGIVAMGSLGADGRFVARQVLAKHDETYMPPEVAESLQAAAEAMEAGQ